MNRMKWTSIWHRNLKVWRKKKWEHIVFYFGEPLIALLALGYGLGQFVGDINGVPYLTFLATGIVCSSTVLTAAFTSFYEGYVRMELQKTWLAMLTTPLQVKDIILGEVIWTGTKGVMGVLAILLVVALFGLVHTWQALWVIPVTLLLGLSMSALCYIATAKATSFEFFSYFHTLGVTMMIFISGVYFPMENLPDPIQMVANILPLSHAVAVVRPLMSGGVPEHTWMHLSIIAAYGFVSYFIAVALVRRRLLD